MAVLLLLLLQSLASPVPRTIFPELERLEHADSTDVAQRKGRGEGEGRGEEGVGGSRVPLRTF